MWPRIADPRSKPPQYNRYTLRFWSPTPYSTDTSYDVTPHSNKDILHILNPTRHILWPRTPLITATIISDSEAHSLQHGYILWPRTPLITARMPLYSLGTSHNLEQSFPNFFPSGPLLASKNNHGSSHPCSRKYGVSRWYVSKTKNLYLRNDFR